MQELERARRLPVYLDVEQWDRAFKAARYEVARLEGEGLLLPQTKESRTLLANRIATAALRAAAQDEEGDLSEVPGVQVAQIANHTATYPIAPPNGVRPSER